jgi:hypothetical protein
MSKDAPDVTPFVAARDQIGSDKTARIVRLRTDGTRCGLTTGRHAAWNWTYEIEIDGHRVTRDGGAQPRCSPTRGEHDGGARRRGVGGGRNLRARGEGRPPARPVCQSVTSGVNLKLTVGDPCRTLSRSMAHRSDKVTVWEVLADIDGDGPACDGTKVFRFRDEGEARAFAATATCYGRPATADSTRVPRRIAERWGMV